MATTYHFVELANIPYQQFSIYYLDGDDDFLMKEAAKIIGDNFLKPSDYDFNFSVIQANKETKASQIYALCQELPLFSKKRVIQINEVKKISGEEKLKLAKFLRESSEKTVLILVAGTSSAAKGNDTKKFEKTIGEIALTVVCSIDEKKMDRWIQQKLAENHYRIRPDAAALLKKKLGGDFWMVHQEIGKLQAYCGEQKEIRLQDVEAVCSTTVDAQIYKITDAILKGNAEKTLQSLDELIGTEEPSVSLLNYIHHFFSGLAAIDQTFKNTNSVSETAKILKKHEFVVKKNLQAIANVSDSVYYQASKMITQTDYMFKKGKNKRMLFETLLIKLCRLFKSTKSNHKRM